MYAYPTFPYMVPWWMLKHAADDANAPAQNQAPAQPPAASGVNWTIPPWLGHALPPMLGAGLGALGGTLYTFWKPQEKRTRIEYIKNVLLGTLLGGLGGLGAGWLYNPFVGSRTSMPPELYKKLLEYMGTQSSGSSS